jgi:hypothetical protein
MMGNVSEDGFGFGSGFSMMTATAGSEDGTGKRIRTILRISDSRKVKVSSWDDGNVPGLTRVVVENGKTRHVLEFGRRN